MFFTSISIQDIYINLCIITQKFNLTKTNYNIRYSIYRSFPLANIYKELYKLFRIYNYFKSYE